MKSRTEIDAGLVGIVRLYCSPEPYWHAIECLQSLLSEPMGGSWLLMVRNYLKLNAQIEPIGLERLSREVENSRAVFHDAQRRASDRYLGARCHQVTPPEYERAEAKAWDRFSAEKQAAFSRFLKGDHTTESPFLLPCPKCQLGKLGPKKRLCAACAALSISISNREAQRRQRAKRRLDVIKHAELSAM